MGFKKAGMKELIYNESNQCVQDCTGVSLVAYKQKGFGLFGIFVGAV